jgi:hypothetical protein
MKLAHYTPTREQMTYLLKHTVNRGFYNKANDSWTVEINATKLTEEQATRLLADMERKPKLTGKLKIVEVTCTIASGQTRRFQCDT